MKNTTPRNNRGWLTSGISLLATVLITVAVTLTAFSLQPGDLDPTFGIGGKLTDWSGVAIDVAIQPDGKIVVVGPINGGFGIARYNPDGSADTTFGSGGKITIAFTSGGSVALQPDGRILVTSTFGTIEDFQAALIRFNSNGSLDSTFDSDGIAFLPTGLILGEVAVQPDGKIVTAGYELGGNVAVARCNSNGSLDSSFDGDGVVTTDFGGSFATSVFIQQNGKILAAGSNSGTDFAVVRYNSDGSLDDGFWKTMYFVLNYNLVESRMQGPEGYTITAITALNIAQKIFDGNFTPGFQTPAKQYGADLVL